MWEKWLDQDTNACWGNLLKVLEELEKINSTDHIIKGTYFCSYVYMQNDSKLIHKLHTI